MCTVVGSKLIFEGLSESKTLVTIYMQTWRYISVFYLHLNLSIQYSGRGVLCNITSALFFCNDTRQ